MDAKTLIVNLGLDYEDFIAWMEHECPGEPIDLEHVEEYAELEEIIRPTLIKRLIESNI